MTKKKSKSKSEQIRLLNDYILNEPNSEKAKRFQKHIISILYDLDIEKTKSIIKKYKSSSCKD